MKACSLLSVEPLKVVCSTATEGGIPRVAAFGVKAQDLLGLVSEQATQAGDGTGR